MRESFLCLWNAVFEVVHRTGAWPPSASIGEAGPTSAKSEAKVALNATCRLARCHDDPTSTRGQGEQI